MTKKDAIKILEQRECCRECVANCTCAECDEALKMAIKALEQEPKTGHWIDDGFYAEGHSHKAFHCSKCGHNVLGFKEDLSNYCPNCGAKMIEPQERSDKE